MTTIEPLTADVAEAAAPQIMARQCRAIAHGASSQRRMHAAEITLHTKKSATLVILPPPDSSHACAGTSFSHCSCTGTNDCVDESNPHDFSFFNSERTVLHMHG
jgi:hypothetical protein